MNASNKDRIPIPLFVASSAEGLDVANAVQQNLDHDAEVTVWSQGVFIPNETSLRSLLAALPSFSFAVFVFRPDDAVRLRSNEYLAVRDNVLFEFGLFVGRLTPERCFAILPRSVQDLHLPSDLLGHRALDYQSDRSDGNLRAALGPACQEIRSAIKRLGPLTPINAALHTSSTTLEEGDQIVVLADWVEHHGNSLGKLIIYADLDRELRLTPGTTKKHIQRLASGYNYSVKVEGPNTILFEYHSPRERDRDSVW